MNNNENGFSLDEILAKISTEVSNEDIALAQNSVQQGVNDENVRMYYRMFAAAPRE